VVTTPVKQVSTCTQEESIGLVIMADLGLDVGHSGESTYIKWKWITSQFAICWFENQIWLLLCMLRVAWEKILLF